MILSVLQIYANVGHTYTHFFETLPLQPEGAIPPLEYSPGNQSFKVLAETPLQGALLSFPVP